MTKELPSPELLRKLLRYEPDTGKLFWRERTPDMFADGLQTAAHKCARWNSCFADSEALTAKDLAGYYHGDVLGRKFRAHRIAWVVHHGSWPDGDIDHINGDRGDNKAKNLRDVTTSQNSRNSKKYSTNKSGVNGVSWNTQKKKWRAEMRLKNKLHFLGYFANINDAIAARKAAEVGHGFTERHGK